jgi:meso-butanediol dehydrogenase/(S,S)-butanediol dehydrogenase/diacetyl reductase
MTAGGAFAGRVVLVTGAGSPAGIGAATARRFAEQGAAVALADRDLDAAQGSAEAIGGLARAYALDVTDPGQVEAVVAAVEADLGPVDVLVNNAGIGERTGFLDLSLEAWRQVMDVNLTGVFLCSQAVARRMVAGQRGGAIVSVASVAGLTAVPGRAAYIASKHGVVGLTRALAFDLGAHGIRVNAVAPGSVETPLTAGLLARPGAREATARRHPIGRHGQPDEIARAIVFLASDEASFITGACLPVDGGFLSGKSI